jgi:outer membrane biosynthesis protein TonB
VAAALVVTACGASGSPAAGTPAGVASAEPTAEATVEPTTAPTPAPAPTATPVPATPPPAPSPTPAPSATPAPTPTPPPAAVETTIEDYVWAYQKQPLALKGATGTTRWTHVLLGAKTVELRWKATPAASAGCRFAYELASKQMAKAVKATAKVKGAKTGSGARSATANYGDGILSVTTDCATWSLRIVATGNPGLVIKQRNDPYKATGSTAAELNDELYEAELDWSYRYNYKYFAGNPVRVTSVTMTLPIDYELPTWAPPDGTDPALVASWKSAVAGMQTHLHGEAALVIQAVGRSLAAAQKKTSFPSVRAAETWYDKSSERVFDSASDRFEAYNEYTDYGYEQGAYVQ